MPQKKDIENKSRADLFVKELLKDDPERIKADLYSTRVVIGVPKSLARTRLGQIALVTATNIIMRLGSLVPNLYFDIPDGVKVLPDIPLLTTAQDLADSLLELTQALAKLQPGVKTRRMVDRTLCYDYGLFVGKTTIETRQSVILGAHRWLSFVRTDGKSERVSLSDPNPLGIILAAGLGSAEIVKRMWLPIRTPSIKIDTITGRVVVSAYDFSVNLKRPVNPIMDGSCELAHACVFGLGAIGSGCMFILGCLPSLRMSLDFVDMDYIEPSNEERLFTSSKPENDLGQLKVLHAEKFIQQLHRNVNTFVYPMRYEDFVTESRDRLGYIWACLDSAKGRRDLQSELASVVCNGATEASRWMVSRHEYDNPDSACLIDLYKQAEATTFDAASELSRQLGLSVREVRRWSNTGTFLHPRKVDLAAARQVDPFKKKVLRSLSGLTYPQAVAQICSTMRPNPTVPAATISFVSLMPAIAMVSDLVKRRVYDWRPEKNEPNLLIFDTFGHPSSSRSMRVSADRSCLCQSQLYREAFEKRQIIRQPDLDRIFRSASLALIPGNLKREVERRKKEYGRHLG